MLEALIRSKVMVKLLGFFTGEPSRDTYLRDISRHIDEPPSAVRRDLERLEEFGLVRSRMVGNQKHFRVNQDFPLLAELKSLLLKTDAMPDYLASELRLLAGVQLAFLYGDFSTHPYAVATELHLVVVGEVEQARLDAKLAEFGTVLARSVDCRQYGPLEFKRLLETKDPSLDTIVAADTIVLVAPEEGES